MNPAATLPRFPALAARLAALLLFGSSAAAGAFNLGGGPLRPQEAFKAEARALDARTIEVRYEIAPDYYLYRDKFRFSAQTPGARLGNPVFPPGRETEDETFGTVVVYDLDATIRIPVEREGAGVLPLTLQATSQGCAGKLGVCYPPEKHTLAVELPDPAAAPAPAAVSPKSSDSPGAPKLSESPGAPKSLDSPESPGATAGDESGRIARLLADSALPWATLCFFGFGLLLSLTPCTFPMWPIVSAIVVGAAPASRARALSLSAAYVLGLSVVYTAAGVAAGLSGALVSSALQNAWALGGLALVFVALALSMFGLIDLRLPACLQAAASRLRGGSLPGAALMGALSALIVGPCVAAPLAGALLYIGRTGDAVLGGLALFCLALGMGAPLIVVGASAGALLPKAGPWMAAVNKIFGVLLLACALWIVSPLLSPAVQMLGWAALLIVPAVFLRALDPLPRRAGAARRFGKAIGVILLLLGIAQLAGALSGARDPLRPLAAFGRQAVDARALPFERIASLEELDARLASAGRPVMLDFYADWCAACKEMERDTFSDPRVRQKLAAWRLLQADVTANAPADQALLKRFALYGPPGIVFFTPAGKEIENVRVIGY
ncbi:MAG: protein-disulfide reductase DsbD, partial [Candidatus Accumulibacter sp.]|nr:protein-disulfide reductase DsbD [Accumulibacter sp.]